MKRRSTLLISILLAVTSLSGCKNKDSNIQWSKWFDNGDGTHSRHDLNDITREETEPHTHELVRYIVEPTDITPGEAQYQCTKCGAKEEKHVPPTGSYVFDQKIVDEKYLCERYSAHSASYYMSSKEGAFGNPDYVFEVSSLPDQYTEVDYVQGDGRQWVNTGVSNDKHHFVSINGSGQNSKIPKDYQQIEYIETTGEQEIDLGFKFDFANDGYEVEFQSTELHQKGMVLGSEYDSNYIYVYHYEDGGHFAQYIGVNDQIENIGGIPLDTLRHVAKYNDSIFSIDNVKLGENTRAGESTHNLYCGSWGGNYYYHGKIYKLKIYRGGILFKDCLPVTRLSDGANGLYDTVGKAFLRCENGHNFNAGSAVPSSSTARLPAEYQEVEYIESSGTQYIDTGIASSSTVCIEVKHSTSTLTSVYGSTTGYNYTSNPAHEGGYFYYWDRASTGVGGYSDTKETEILKQDNNLGYRNNELVHTFPYLEFTDTNNIWLFGRNADGSLSDAGDTKLYYCKIWNNGVLTRDFIPCIRSLDNQAGLYDLVSNTFYRNTGSDEFIAGSIINYSVDSRLPSDYQEVEYLETDGDQYIDTRINGNNVNLKVTATYEIKESREMPVFGARNNSYGGLSFWTTGYCHFGNATKKISGITSTGKHHVELSKNGLVFDSSTKEFEAGTDMHNANLTICSIPGDERTFVGKLFSVEVYDNDTKILELVPCYEKATRRAGMFDVVKNEFYGNAGDDADFAVGDEVYHNSDSSRLPLDYQEVEYVQTTGSQLIKTGVIGPARWYFDIEYLTEHVNERQLMGHGGSGGEYWGITNGKWALATWYGTDVDVSGRNIYNVNNVPQGMSHYLNEQYLYETEYDNRSDSNQCTLFALPSGTFYNYCKLYNCKVYDQTGTNLIRNFVPCYRRLDGMTGLYDLVTNNFYTPEGPDLLHGEDVYNSDGELPHGYEELTYIASTGTQFINTGIISKPGIRADIEMRYEQVSNTKNNWSTVFGDYYSGGQTFNIWANESDNTLKVYGSKTQDDGATLPISAGTKATVSIEASDSVVDNNQELYIFSINNPGTYEGYNQPFELYSLRMYDGEELVRNFIPCCRTESNEVGLFDTVSNMFFGNDGSGNFVKGPVAVSQDSYRDEKVEKIAGIPEYYYQLNYIESTSIQSVDTGISGSALIDLKIKYNLNASNQIMGYGTEQGEYFGVGANGMYLGSGLPAGNIDRLVCDFGNTTPGQGKISINDQDSEPFEIAETGEKHFNLFAAGEAARSSVLLYEAKIYKGTNLVRNFVPVLQKYTGIPGLFDTVEGRFYTSNTKHDLVGGGIVSDDLNDENINIFCNTGANKSHPFKTQISTYQIFEDNKLKNDYVACIRNSDGVAGFYDLKNNTFITSSSEFPLTYGKIIGHKLDEGKVVKSPTYNEEGEIVYKCVYTGQEVHQKVDRTAYKITFVPENEQLTGVKIFNNNNPNDYIMSLVGYSRNINTYNYSKSGAYIYFEIPDDGKEYDIITFGGTLEKLEGRRYKIKDIKSDLYVQLRQI